MKAPAVLLLLTVCLGLAGCGSSTAPVSRPTTTIDQRGVALVDGVEPPPGFVVRTDGPFAEAPYIRAYKTAGGTGSASGVAAADSYLAQHLPVGQPFGHLTWCNQDPQSAASELDAWMWTSESSSLSVSLLDESSTSSLSLLVTYFPEEGGCDNPGPPKAKTSTPSGATTPTSRSGKTAASQAEALDRNLQALAAFDGGVPRNVSPSDMADAVSDLGAATTAVRSPRYSTDGHVTVTVGASDVVCLTVSATASAGSVSQGPCPGASR